MKKIAIIGANSFQNKLIMKAKDMGYETHVFAWETGDIGEKNADYFYPISICEKDKILEKCKEIGIDGICSIASDLAVLTVNYVARKMGLVGNSEFSDQVSTNKYEMRETFMKSGIQTLKHKRVTSESLKTDDFSEFKFPVVVKPTDRSGSRAITLVNSVDEIESAVLKAIDQSFEQAAIVEEYIRGKEFSCECISYNGKHQCLAMTEKFTTGEPNYIEYGHIEPAQIGEDDKKRIIEIIYKALDSLDIKFGASHTEFRLDVNGNFGIIEIGARMGGDCIGSDLVLGSTGIDFVKAIIEIAVGEKPELSQIFKDQYVAIRFIMSKDDMDIIEWAEKNTELMEVSDMNFSNEKIVDSSSRYGYFIVKSNEYSTLKRLMKFEQEGETE